MTKIFQILWYDTVPPTLEHDPITKKLDNETEELCL